MDTSPEYLKICEKAEEIQALRREQKHENTGKWQMGDFYFDLLGQVHIVDEYRDAWSDEPDYLHHPAECVWLPRQDQLQEMVWEGSKNTRSLVLEFADWLEYKTNYRRESLEQLWLAFVMKEKYSKLWSGQDWVKEAP